VYILCGNLKHFLKARNKAVSLPSRHDLENGSHECMEFSRGIVLQALALWRAEDVNFSSVGCMSFANDQASISEGVDCDLQRRGAQVQFAG